MTKLLICFLCCLLSLAGQGQEDVLTTQKGAKFYLHASHNYSPKARNTVTSFSNKISFVSPGLAFFWQQQQSYTEISIADWFIVTQKNNLEEEEMVWNASMKFEQGWKVGKSQKGIQVYLGYGLQPYVQRYTAEPQTSANFQKKHTSIGIQTQFIPKLSYQLGNDWFIDLSIPITFSDFATSSFIIRDPSLTVAQQQQIGFDVDFLVRTVIWRLGVGKTF